MKRLFLLIFPFIFFMFANSQSDFEPHNSFKVEIGLPNNITNLAFRELMQGLVIVTPSFQSTFSNSFSVAAGLRYGYFNVNQFKNNIGMTGGAHLVGIFGKIGQEKFYGNFGLDYGIRVGYTINIFATNKNKELLGQAYHNDGGFVEPTIGLILKANESSSYRFALGYAFHAFQFQPNQMGVEKFSGINPSKLNELTTYFTVGFGYSFYFLKK